MSSFWRRLCKHQLVWSCPHFPLTGYLQVILKLTLLSLYSITLHTHYSGSFSIDIIYIHGTNFNICCRHEIRADSGTHAAWHTTWKLKHCIGISYNLKNTVILTVSSTKKNMNITNRVYNTIHKIQSIVLWWTSSLLYIIVYKTLYTHWENVI